MLLGTWVVVKGSQDEVESNCLLAGAESVLSLTLHSVHSCGKQTFTCCTRDKPERETTGWAGSGAQGLEGGSCTAGLGSLSLQLRCGGVVWLLVVVDVLRLGEEQERTISVPPNCSGKSVTAPREVSASTCKQLTFDSSFGFPQLK